MAQNGITQWGWKEMEELLQCPVCLDVPEVGIVEQCRHGHHLCSACKRNLDSCPLCKCSYYGTRNFILEELLRHFDVLKNTMLLNNIVVEDKRKKRKPKVRPLRDDRPTELLKQEPVKRKVSTAIATEGTYPCRAADCDVELPVARLLNHVRSRHPDMLTESVVDFTDTYSQTFQVSFKNKMPVNKNTYIIFVSGIGLVYLNIEIMQTGQLIVFLQMASKFQISQQYLGSVELFCETAMYSHSIRLVSTRISFPAMMIQSACFTLSKPQVKRICVNDKFNCKLTLTRFNLLSTNQLPSPNREQIVIIAGIRASLLSKYSDKKRVNQSEACKNKKTAKVSLSTCHNPRVSNHTSANAQTNTHPPAIEEIVAKVLESLNFQEALSNFSGNVNNNSSTSSNTTRNQCLNGRQNSKKNKKKTRTPNGN